MTMSAIQHDSGMAHAELNARASAGGKPVTGDAFQQLLSAADGPNAEQQVREAATQFVSSAFIEPVLAMMHDSPFAEEPFAPNAAERRFMPLLDQHIADRVTSAANFTLVDSIVKQVMSSAGATPDAPDRRDDGGVDVSA